MKILIFSDTHRRTQTMADILARSRRSVDLVLHLGDCYTDLAEIRDDFPEIAFLGVRGNCDLFANADFPDENAVSFEGHRLFFTHGHRYDIKRSDVQLLYAAKKAGADIALFGHTHVGTLYTKEGITLFNPGSLSEPRDGHAGSYGRITLENGSCRMERLFC